MKTSVTVPREAAEPPWKRLDRLLLSRQKEILRREEVNDGLIHIYDCGDFVAFERSACQFHRMFPDADLTVLNLRSYPFPVIMLSVRPEEFRLWSREHIVTGSGSDLTVEPSSPLPLDAYSRWHRDALEGNL